MNRRFLIAGWRVDPDRNEISRAGNAQTLDNKVMQLLEFLSRHPGQDLSKEEVLQAVWGEGINSEEVLTVAVSNLRKAFGDDPANPTIIKTIPRYGYRMLQSTTQDPHLSQRQSLLQWLDERVGLRFLIVSCLILTALVIFLIISLRGHPHP